MLSIGGIFLAFLVVGFFLLAVKVLIALVLIPLKIGLGLFKLAFALLIGLPLLILGIVALPLIVVGLPALALVLLTLGVIAAPFILAFKALT